MLEYRNFILHKRIVLMRKTIFNHNRIVIPFITWSTGAFLNKNDTDSAINSWM